jgi:hypothetical protein
VFDLFTKPDGTSFDLLTVEAKKITILCDTLVGRGRSVSTFSRGLFGG